MRLLTSLIILAVLIVYGCQQDDDFITDSGAQLTFSTDTVFFDTVFTELGSATQILKAYNPHDKPIRISEIAIQNDASSLFRINIDGIPGNSAKDIEIAANDSLYIFAEVTIDPDAPLSLSPFVVTDEIVFLTNNNEQSVVLQAWGQNAIYFPGRANKGQGTAIVCNGGDFVWTDSLPIVLYGTLFIDSCNLIVEEGTQIYVHGGLGTFTDENDIRQFFNDGRLFIGPRGSIQVRGTRENPVVIQGDRLESAFDEEPGQWYGVVLTAGSKGNSLEYTTIKNSVLGIAADSAAELSMKNTQIYNTTASSIIGIQSTIEASNCLVYNSSSTAVNLIYGGNYDFTYCTFASYGVNASALSLSNTLCLDAPFCNDFRAFPLNATFTNSIIFGSLKDEIELLDRTVGEVDFNYQFDYCVVKIEELTDIEQYANFFDFCNGCINGRQSDRLFVSSSEDNYRLDSLSIAEEKATPIQNIFIDLDGNMRDAATPDVGCYEFK